MNEGKKKALEMALSQIEKEFGKGSVMTLGENDTMNVDHIPTGSFTCLLYTSGRISIKLLIDVLDRLTEYP